MKTSLAPSVVKTLLDGVMFPEFNYKQHPDFHDATSSLLFKQETSDKAQETLEVFGGTPLWAARGEEQDVQIQYARVGNQKTFSNVTYSSKRVIPKTFFDDQMHSTYNNMIRDFAIKAAATRDQNAFAVFRDGFTTATTSDGVALFSASHLTTQGETISNLITPAFSETALNTGIISFLEQKDEAGIVMGNMPETLLVPPALYKIAVEVTQAEKKSGGNNNEYNVYSTKYGINVATSNRLGAASGGSDSKWFLLGRNHSIMRYVRTPLFTDLIDYKFSDNNSYVYKGEFREVVGAMHYSGIIASNATT